MHVYMHVCALVSDHLTHDVVSVRYVYYAAQNIIRTLSGNMELFLNVTCKLHATNGSNYDSVKLPT